MRPPLAFPLFVVLLLAPGAAAQFDDFDPTARPKPDAASRLARIRDFLAADDAKRAEIAEEAAAWPPIPFAEVAAEIEALRTHVPKRTLDRDKKKQPVLRGTEKWKVDGKDFEYQWVLPKEYDPAKPTPLVIYLHGSNGPQGTGPWDGWANSQGAILVAPASPNRSYWHPVAGATDPKDYEETFFFTLMTAWRNKFNLDWNRIVVCGFSSGGFGSWWFSLRYPDWFAAVIPMAGGPPANWGERGPYEHVGQLPYWIFHGEKDVEVPPDLDRAGVAGLKKLGTPVEYKEYPGETHGSWFGKDPEIAKTVTRVISEQRRIVWPKRIVWTWDEEFVKLFPGVTRVMGSGWLELGEHGRMARLEGEIVAPNTVQLRARAVTSARVLVLDGLFDLTKPVEVKWDGHPPFQGTVDVDLGLMLREFAARPDPNRIVLGEVRMPARK